MPAIDIAELAARTAILAGLFSQPEAFVRSLHELLDSYTNRTVRSPRFTYRASIPSYRTPRPVLRKIESILAPLLDQHPADAVVLTSALWDAGYLETRLIAARALGMIPSVNAISTFARLPDWLSQNKDSLIQRSLLTDSFSRIRRENPGAFLLILDGWINTHDSKQQGWALSAIIPLLEDPHFEDLPSLFKIIRPAVLDVSPMTQLELQHCLAVMEKRFIVETAHFLREVVRENPNPELLRTLRRILLNLSLALREGLRETLRQYDE
ncbi:MAG: hypothetical protein ABIJ39_11615 [Chloroflexota bacterium]